MLHPSSFDPFVSDGWKRRFVLCRSVCDLASITMNNLDRMFCGVEYGVRNFLNHFIFFELPKFPLVQTDKLM